MGSAGAHRAASALRHPLTGAVGASPTLGHAVVGQRCWDVLQTLELGGGRQMSAACLCARNCRTFER